MADPAPKALDGPKCHEPMRALKAGDAIVDRCEKCYGVWLDDNERMKLMHDKALVHGVDIGPVAVGREQDEITDVACPRCAKPMEHVQDPAQRHIGYELCRDCGGSFFDAGELTDLSEFTLSERIKTLFGR